MFMKLWSSQLPAWARHDHPIMQSVLGRLTRLSKRARLLRTLALVLFVAAVAGAGLTLRDEYTNRELVYAPLVFLQGVAVIIALTLTTNAVSSEQQRGTWDTLKLTLVGVSHTLRTRWLAVFYQLRWILLLITVGRIVFLGLFFRDISEFQGRALDLYITGITPEVSLDMAFFMVVCFMTAFLIQPFIAVAVSAAVGVVLSVVINSRALVFVLMLVVIGVYMGSVWGGITIGEEIIINRAEVLDEDTPVNQQWGALALMSLAGDMGITLTQLEIQAELWATLNNSIYWGAIYMVALLVIGLAANLVVEFSAKRATYPTRH